MYHSKSIMYFSNEHLRLLGLRVRIPSGTWMCVSCECCVFSRTGLCDGPTKCGVSECGVSGCGVSECGV